MSKKAVWFHRPVAEDQWSLDSTLRAVDLEDRALAWQVGSPFSSLQLLSPKGDWTWRWARLAPILWLNLPLWIERNVSSLPSARIAILHAMSVAPWQEHSFGMRCVFSSGLCFLQQFSVPPSKSFLRKLSLEWDFYVPFCASVQFQWGEESLYLILADKRAFVFELWCGIELFCVEQGIRYRLLISVNLLVRRQFKKLLLPSCSVLLSKAARSLCFMLNLVLSAC